MLQRSIPQYDVMRKAVTDAACWFAGHGIAPRIVVDLGAARGSALAPIVERLGNTADYRAYEISEPMLKVMRQRFHREIADGLMKVFSYDLRKGFPFGPYGGAQAAAVLSVLTLQFVPIEYRQKVIQGVHDALSPGGGFIWVEKVLGATATLDSMEVDLYYETKRDNGYTQEAIDRKRLSLEGVLVPLTAAFNEDLLRQAGFRQIDCIWAWMNFRAWVAVG
jgi:tRNA (cmo5U34)-methyltransferase